MSSSKCFKVGWEEYLLYPSKGIFYPDRAEKHEIKLIAHRRFSPSNLTIHGSEEFCKNYLEASSGYGEFYLFEVEISHGWLHLRYRGDSGHYGTIKCKRVTGLSLEFEIKRVDSEKTDKCLLEYDNDRFLGKLIRIWERKDSPEERRITILEDGHIIMPRA